MCDNETMKKPIPDVLFYVYFTKKELLNINPCRFTNYEDAYNYAIRYDKSLIYTKIIPYKPTNDTYMHNTILFDKMMRKIFLYNKFYNNKLIHTERYENDKSDEKSTNYYARSTLHTEILLYKNILISINLCVSLHGCDTIPFNNKILIPNQSNVFAGSYFKQRHCTENNRYLWYINTHRYWAEVLSNNSKVYLDKSFGKINIAIYKDEYHKDEIVLCTNDNYYIYNYYKKLDEMLRHSWEYKVGSDSHLLIRDLLAGKFDAPLYSGRKDNATEFLSDYLSDKNV